MLPEWRRQKKRRKRGGAEKDVFNREREARPQCE